MLRHRRYVRALGGQETVAARFATAVLVGFPPPGHDDADDDCVEVINFGHEPPLVVGPSGVRALPPGDGLPLGLADLAEGTPKLTPQRVPLAAGETLLLVTDGVTEARDAAGVFFPLAAALSRGSVTRDPRDLVRLVRDGTLRHCGGRLADDTTIFAVRRPVRHNAVK